MRMRHILTGTLALLLAAGCGSTGADPAPERGGPPPGAPEAVREYVEALNNRDTQALLTVGAAPDKPWSRRQAEQIIRDRGGRGLTINSVPIRYDHMGRHMGRASLKAADRQGAPVREALELMHEHKRWHVVLFEWPSDGKVSSKP